MGKILNSLEKKEIPRPEYPRPQFVRKDNWINLNGEWNFAFDDSDTGLKERWNKKEQKGKFDKKIVVPFCFQSKLSGIEDTSFHDIVWYRKEFAVPEEFMNGRVLLNFGAVDYSCAVYLNGESIGTHEGGYIGFTLDVSDFIEKNNVLVVRVQDPSTDLEIPRGKQFWYEKLQHIFYPRVTGLWQTVWLEAVSRDYRIEGLKLTPDVDKSNIIIECEVDGVGVGFPELSLLAEIFFENDKINEIDISLNSLGNAKIKRDKKLIKAKSLTGKLVNPNRFKFKISIPKNALHLWDVENPNLYDIIIKICNKSSKEIHDEVKSYFGMRKISLSESPEEVSKLNDEQSDITSFNRQVLLNDTPIYQKLFLVQGYWPDGLYTAPSDDAIKLDIQYIKGFGFNGLRTHQKAFDPRFLYWCDKMGVLVWGEIGNAYQFSTRSQLRLINEFAAEIERDYNHPSIIAWTVLNESWGVPGADRDERKRDYTLSLYYLMKSIDPTRLIVDDDGWFHCVSDMCTIHYYSAGEFIPKSFEDGIRSFKKARPKIYLKPHEYNGEPIIYSEIGGFGYDLHGEIKEKWGYGNTLQDSEELYTKVLELLKEFDKRKEWIHGFCYTELYDQFQEINGLLTFDREPKFEPLKLKKELDKMFY